MEHVMKQWELSLDRGTGRTEVLLGINPDGEPVMLSGDGASYRIGNTVFPLPPQTAGVHLRGFMQDGKAVLQTGVAKPVPYRLPSEEDYEGAHLSSVPRRVIVGSVVRFEHRELQLANVLPNGRLLVTAWSEEDDRTAIHDLTILGSDMIFGAGVPGVVTALYALPTGSLVGRLTQIESGFEVKYLVHLPTGQVFGGYQSGLVSVVSYERQGFILNHEERTLVPFAYLTDLKTKRFGGPPYVKGFVDLGRGRTAYIGRPGPIDHRVCWVVGDRALAPFDRVSDGLGMTLEPKYFYYAQTGSVLYQMELPV